MSNRARNLVAQIGNCSQQENVSLDELVLLTEAEFRRIERETLEKAAKIADEMTAVPYGAWGEGAKYNAEKIARLIRQSQVGEK